MLKAVVGINWGDEGKGRIVRPYECESELCCTLSGRK